MKKVIISVFFSLLMCGALAGCNRVTPPEYYPDYIEGSVTSTDADIQEEATVTVDEQPEAAVSAADVSTNASDAAVSDNLFDYGFELDGAVYSLPFAYSDFAAAGWNCKNADSDTIPSMNMTLSRLADNGKSSLYVRMVNPYNSEKVWADCRVAAISLDVFSLDESENRSFSVAKGIDFSSTEADVRAAFGEPTRVYEGTSLVTLFYEEGGSNQNCIEFSFDSADGSMYEIALTNMVAEDLPDDSQAERNEAAAAYTAPASIGDSYDSFAFILFDDIYSMPAPVSYYLEKGWEPVNFSLTDTIRGNGSAYGMQLRKNGQTITVSYENLSGSVCPVTDCFVVEFTVGGSFHGDVPVTLGGGISVGSDLQDAINAWGEPDKSESASGYTSTTFGEYGRRVVLSSDDADGRILSINIQNSK